jgi:hypothetical protein
MKKYLRERGDMVVVMLHAKVILAYFAVDCGAELSMHMVDYWYRYVICWAKG